MTAGMINFHDSGHDPGGPFRPSFFLTRIRSRLRYAFLSMTVPLFQSLALFPYPVKIQKLLKKVTVGVLPMPA
jgi:hypothetical protein